MKDNNAIVNIPSYSFSSWVFLRLLALTYLIAFLSLAVQILGLVGSHGIMPTTYFLNVAHQQLGTAGYWLFPGIFWLNSSDLFIQIVCACGVLFSVVLFFGFAQPIMLFLLWFLYLSLSSICRDFLSFQWDILL
ncbi:MAG TPA: lipase maturation factor family protein, partial [Acidobacteriota bacterium]|nr:lipase maturation factor family protein [Acidobacteriota bacterium]